MSYFKYLNEQIKRLELIDSYKIKMDKSNKEKTKKYYSEGIRLLLNSEETIDNYKEVLQEYKEALALRKERVKELYNEIKIIKKLRL